MDELHNSPHLTAGRSSNSHRVPGQSWGIVHQWREGRAALCSSASEGRPRHGCPDQPQEVVPVDNLPGGKEDGDRVRAWGWKCSPSQTNLCQTMPAVLGRLSARQPHDRSPPLTTLFSLPHPHKSALLVEWHVAPAYKDTPTTQSHNTATLIRPMYSYIQTWQVAISQYLISVYKAPKFNAN